MRFTRHFEHDLGPELARDTIAAAALSYRARFDKYAPSFAWRADDRFEFRFRAKGLEISGAIELRTGSVSVEIEVPVLLVPLKGRALAIVERELESWIDRARAGGLAGTACDADG
ncbi:MAG: polyhydroxyalkanoic acid system family protein [Deltaproteobacteria bacterium]|nr:polyhydroxyalkanoic acid system family protein [Deltaproteobacteria bacterium]MBW2535043.1 polyhydroxyalkanoic acid system family protein [Deltaproteobacteria bacterium]